MATRLKARLMSAKVKPRHQSRRSGRQTATSDVHARSTLSTLLGELPDMIFRVAVVHRLLSAEEADRSGDEEVTLGLALRLLHGAPDRINQAFLRSRMSRLPRSDELTSPMALRPPMRLRTRVSG